MVNSQLLSADALRAFFLKRCRAEGATLPVNAGASLCLKSHPNRAIRGSLADLQLCSKSIQPDDASVNS